MNTESDIYLSEIMTNLKPLNEYKMHFAKYDQYNAPLDVFLESFEEWKHWNEWSNGKNEFNRKYIFSLIDFYPERDTWLFGGIWEVIAYNPSKEPGTHYTIELCPDYQKFIGRLKIKYAHNDRMVRNRMENYFPSLVLKEILREPYSIETFPGYKNLDIRFKSLKMIMSKGDPIWKTALSIKGIYLLTDIRTGMKYVGKASGKEGFWQRWGGYIASGHGGDVDLERLLKDEGGIQYAIDNFKFSILEIVESNMDDDIDSRESHWKRVLMSRLPNVGHNKN